MLPIRLERILIEKIWGGRNLESLNMNLPKSLNVGESWEIAAHKEHVNRLDKSIVNDIYSLEGNTPKKLWLNMKEYQDITYRKF